MNRQTLARNLLILHQVEEITYHLAKQRIPVVFLKGVALIAVLPSYNTERVMEDADLLFRPEDIGAARKVLSSLGYSPAYQDPWAFRHPAKSAYIDIIDHLWYLDRKENQELFDESRRYPVEAFPSSAFHLPPEDFYIHVLAHAAAHHGRKERTWLRDLELMRETWGNSMDWKSVGSKLKRYGFEEVSVAYLTGGEGGKPLPYFYRFLVERCGAERGHVLRFVLMPRKKKPGYLFATLFPSTEFIMNRYSLKNRTTAYLYRIARPFLLFSKLITLPFRH